MTRTSVTRVTQGFSLRRSSRGFSLNGTVILIVVRRQPKGVERPRDCLDLSRSRVPHPNLAFCARLGWGFFGGEWIFTEPLPTPGVPRELLQPRFSPAYPRRISGLRRRASTSSEAQSKTAADKRSVAARPG